MLHLNSRSLRLCAGFWCEASKQYVFGDISAEEELQTKEYNILIIARVKSWKHIKIKFWTLNVSNLNVIVCSVCFVYIRSPLRKNNSSSKSAVGRWPGRWFTTSSSVLDLADFPCLVKFNKHILRGRYWGGSRFQVRRLEHRRSKSDCLRLVFFILDGFYLLNVYFMLRFKTPTRHSNDDTYYGTNDDTWRHSYHSTALERQGFTSPLAELTVWLLT